MGDVAGMIQARVEQEFEKLEKQAKEFFDTRQKEISSRDRTLREESEARLKEVEDNAVRDVRTRVFPVVLLVVVSAAGAMLIGSFAALREVNNQVISLQNSIISTQITIKDADKALAEQTKKLSEADAALTAKTATLDASNRGLQEAKSQLDGVRGELDRVRENYNTLIANTRNATALLEKTKADLDTAREEYMRISNVGPK